MDSVEYLWQWIVGLLTASALALLGLGYRSTQGMIQDTAKSVHDMGELARLEHQNLHGRVSAQANRMNEFLERLTTVEADARNTAKALERIEKKQDEYGLKIDQILQRLPR